VSSPTSRDGPGLGIARQRPQIDSALDRESIDLGEFDGLEGKVVRLGVGCGAGRPYVAERLQDDGRPETGDRQGLTALFARRFR
jgi:hypothetical protein